MTRPCLLLSWLTVLGACEVPGHGELPVLREGAPLLTSDQFISEEEEALAEQFNPNHLYTQVDDSIADAVVVAAKQLTNSYAGVANPKVRAREVQRLVRDSLAADILVVATVVGVTQENRELSDGEVVPWTMFEFEVARVLLTDDSIDRFTLSKLGGEIDGVVTRACGMPDFALDQSYLLALEQWDEPSGLFLVNGEAAWVVVGEEIPEVMLTIAELQVAQEGWQ